MIVIICAKYKKNPFRAVDATERTGLSKSMPNDLEDIGQGQGSLNATHPLMLLIICTKYGKNPSWSVDATERTRDAGRTPSHRDINTQRQTICNSEIICEIILFCMQIQWESHDHQECPVGTNTHYINTHYMLGYTGVSHAILEM